MISTSDRLTVNLTIQLEQCPQILTPDINFGITIFDSESVILL